MTFETAITTKTELSVSSKIAILDYFLGNRLKDKDGNVLDHSTVGLIKIIRYNENIGLKEAKDFVDAIKAAVRNYAVVGFNSAPTMPANYSLGDLLRNKLGVSSSNKIVNSAELIAVVRTQSGNISEISEITLWDYSKAALVYISR